MFWHNILAYIKEVLGFDFVKLQGGPTLGLEPKSASGTYNALYKYPRALYMFLTHTFIYLETMCNIEEKYD